MAVAGLRLNTLRSHVVELSIFVVAWHIGISKARFAPGASEMVSTNGLTRRHMRSYGPKQCREATSQVYLNAPTLADCSLFQPRRLGNQSSPGCFSRASTQLITET